MFEFRKITSVLVILFSVVSARAELSTVPYVDVARFVGSWYQIARNPLFFEDGCVCSLQKLSPNSQQGLDVVNSCNDKTANGPLRTIRGTATVVDTVSNAKLTVDFGLPKIGNYWIIGLANDYRYAVVSEPSEKSLYILSKTPVLDKASYDEAVAIAALQTDVSKLLMTEQTNCIYH